MEAATINVYPVSVSEMERAQRGMPMGPRCYRWATLAWDGRWVVLALHRSEREADKWQRGSSIAAVVTAHMSQVMYK